MERTFAEERRARSIALAAAGTSGSVTGYTVFVNLTKCQCDFLPPRGYSLPPFRSLPRRIHPPRAHGSRDDHTFLEVNDTTGR